MDGVLEKESGWVGEKECCVLQVGTRQPDVNQVK